MEGRNLASFAQLPCPPTQRRWRYTRYREEGVDTVLGAHLLSGQVGRKKPVLFTACSQQAWARDVVGENGRGRSGLGHGSEQPRPARLCVLSLMTIGPLFPLS